MKKIGLLIAIIFVSLLAFAQEDGSTMQQPDKLPPLEVPWEKVNVGEFSEPVPYSPQRESDVMQYITIWRTIDLREKINHPLYFPITQKGTWRSLAQVILDAIDIKSPDNPNALPVYNEDECTERKTTAGVISGMSEAKTTPIYDPETNEEIGTSSYDDFYGPEAILSYRLKEVWFFDRQRSTLQTIILYVSPMIDKVKDNSQEDMGELMDDDMDNVGATVTQGRLGYIRYNDLRPYLAKQEVFNPRNSAQKMSLDDLLTHKRIFSSRIIARENVYGNREIQEYFTNPRDQVLESDRISAEIRQFEHDLWEF